MSSLVQMSENARYIARSRTIMGFQIPLLSRLRPSVLAKGVMLSQRPHLTSSLLYNPSGHGNAWNQTHHGNPHLNLRHWRTNRLTAFSTLFDACQCAKRLLGELHNSICHVFDKKRLAWHHSCSGVSGWQWCLTASPHPTPKLFSNPCLQSLLEHPPSFPYCLAVSLPVREDCPVRCKRDFARTWSGTWVLHDFASQRGKDEKQAQNDWHLDSERTWQ